MKKLISAILVLAVVAAFLSGCGKAQKRVLYNLKLSKYMTLGNYEEIKVDKSSDKFKEYYTKVVSGDVESSDLYVKKTTGKVADGDTVNIDYTGKKDGVAFEGGTAQGSDLEIGSNSFIEGFESGLIGVEVGATVNLNLKFPENYSSSPDLAGKAVVFTVKVNYIKTKEERKPEDFYSELNYKSVDEYVDDAENRAVKNFLIDTVTDKTKIKDYPKDDMELLYNSYKSMTEQNIQSQYGADLATYLQSMGQTEEQFKSDMIEKQIKPAMKQQMALYAIFDKEKLELKDTDISSRVDEMVKSYNSDSVTAEKLKEFYGDYYFEYMVVSEKAMDLIYKSAKIY